MKDPHPTARQRDVLQKLMQREWTPSRQLAPAGEAMLENLVGKAWIEKRSDSKGGYLFSITKEGRVAFSTPMPLRR
jgi:hypothetical protein